MRLLGLGALNMENSRGFAFLDPDEHEDFFPPLTKPFFLTHLIPYSCEYLHMQ